MLSEISKYIVTFIIFTFLSLYFVSCEKNEDEELIFTTKVITGVTYISATSGGLLDDQGHPGEWEISEKGVCWSATNMMPTINDNRTIDGSGGGDFISFLLPLEPNTEYYYRAYAIYKGDIIYGRSNGGYSADAESFKTLALDSIKFNTSLFYGSVTDIEGNIYKTIQIGSQEWMAENLRVKKYSNGSPITNVTDNYEWNKLTTGAYCDYRNVESFSIFFGRIYNWEAVASSNKICPSGWHVPSDSEWKILETSLGMSQFQVDSASWRGTDEGVKLKEIAHWKEKYNINNTNSSGFTALPDGYRFANGTFGNNGFNGGWWTSTQDDEKNAWYRGLSFSQKTIKRSTVEKVSGNSIRCVKD